MKTLLYFLSRPTFNSVYVMGFGMIAITWAEKKIAWYILLLMLFIIGLISDYAKNKWGSHDPR